MVKKFLILLWAIITLPYGVLVISSKIDRASKEMKRGWVYSQPLFAGGVHQYSNCRIYLRPNRQPKQIPQGHVDERPTSLIKTGYFQSSTKAPA